MSIFSAHAYAIQPGPNDWVAAFRVANRLLRRGMRVLVVPDGSESEDIEPGAFVVPLSRTFDPWFTGNLAAEDVHQAATDADVALVPIGGERLIATPLASIRVGLYGGGGAPFNHAAILAACGFPVQFLSDAEVRGGALAEVDVFVMPGGGFRAMHGQIEPLGEEGCRAIADFVRRGGMYIGCCAGSYDCIVNSEAFLRSCPTQGCLQLINAGPWRSDGAVEFLDLQSPGVGVVTVRNVRPDHPVMYGMPASFEIVHYNGPVLDPLPARPVEGAAAAAGLAIFTGPTDRFTPAESFAGPPPGHAPTYLDRAVAAERFSIVAGALGIGRVVAFGSHPEFGFDLPMVKWSQPARMLANAVRWQAMSRRTTPATASAPIGRRISLPVGSALAVVPPAASALAKSAHALEGRPIDAPLCWLAPTYALSVFGLPPAKIWRESLAQIQLLAAAIATLSTQLRERIDALVGERSGEVDAPVLDALIQIESWVLDERPPEWEQDGGYQGVLALLRTAARMCETALANWEIALGPPAGPYGHCHENPYHLVAGSYLAATGCAAGALHLLHALDAELTMAEWLAPARNREAVVASRVDQREAG